MVSSCALAFFVFLCCCGQQQGNAEFTITDTNKKDIALQSSSCINKSRKEMNGRNDSSFPARKQNPKIPAKSIAWTVLMFTFVTCLFVVSVAGNGLTIFTIVKEKSLQNTQNYLVFNLAISDLFTVVVVLPLMMIIWHVPWPFGRFSCKYLLPICDILPPVSILTLVAISIDRYRAIVYALSRPLTIKIGIAYIVASWVICYLTVGLPMSLVVELDQNKICMPLFKDTNWRTASYTLRTILFYIFPSTIIFVCYRRVNSVLGTSMHFLKRSVSGKSKILSLRRQKRAMKMFFAIFLTFVICYLPLNVYILLTNYVQDRETLLLLHTYLSEASIMCGFANSACNPIILYLLSTTYCKSFQKILPFLKYFRRKHNFDDESTSNSWLSEDSDDGKQRRGSNLMTELNMRRETVVSNIGLFFSTINLRNTNNNNLQKKASVITHVNSDNFNDSNILLDKQEEPL